jgi:hypothetical protein
VISFDLFSSYPDALKHADSNKKLPLHLTLEFHSTKNDLIKMFLSAYPESLTYADKYYRSPLYIAVSNLTSIDIIQQMITSHPEALKCVSISWLTSSCCIT